MERIKLLLTAMCVSALFGSAPAFAETFPVSATIPAANSIAFIVTEAETVNNVTTFFTDTTQEGEQPLNFDTAGDGMQFDAVNGIWAASRFFVIDVAPQFNGDPAPGDFNSISIDYNDTSNPNVTPGTGLDAKGIVTVVRIETQVDPNDPNNLIEVQSDPIVQEAFGDVGTAPIDPADISGGFMRTFVGISTGDPNVPVGEPFTNADAPGTYSGDLIFTITLNP